jgi:hypothetical protein
MNILHSIGAGVAALGLFVGGLFGYAPVSDNLGASLPSGTAVFETSLATGITNLSTSMVLTSTSIRGGGTLSGYECFTIDEGSAQAEYVCGTVATNTVSSLERGISPEDGVTSLPALTFSHRRGANVKITDFPLIQRLRAQNSGDGTFDAPIKYAASVSTTTLSSEGQNIASVAYANSLSFGAVAAANETTAGFTELATAQEAASSTSLGSTGARLSLSTSLSTSTAPASGHVVVMTGIDGNIDTGFISDTIGSSSLTAYAASSSAYTYTKPTGLKYIIVEGQAGGGGGGDGTSSGGGGGGGGGYFKRLIAASSLNATTSFRVGLGGTGAPNSTTVGTVGSSTIFGNFATSTGGDGGSTGGSGSNGGTATGGNLNIAGGSGGANWQDSNQGSSVAYSGVGGSSFLGNSAAIYGYGSGAFGYGYGGSGGSAGGGTGADGILIISEHY